MAILVTGGAGYIGSHTCVELLNKGEEVVILDNFCNSKPTVLNIIRELTNKDFKFYQIDLLDKNSIRKVFEENKIDIVIHFAGLKAVGESVEKPLMYYNHNINSTINLCEIMSEYNCKKIVFSSSATVYGQPKSVPISEDFPLSSASPYGKTKLMIEEILGDLYISDKEWSVVLLRYFNPIGAHISGRIGEDPNGIPNNLLPYISQVAVGKLKTLGVFGNDYPTKDGTGVRDYIHVVDLALGHIKAVIKGRDTKGVNIYNLGTGKGYSVFDVIKSFEKASKRNIDYKIMPRRAGDIPEYYGNPQKAYDELGWKAELDLDRMCEDSWRFISMNPNGL